MGILITGIVKDTKDPDNLGRVLVDLKGFTQSVELPWLRLLNPYASVEFGVVLLPEVGDEVLILKGNGDDFAQMYVMGSLYNGTNKPAVPDSDGKNNVKELLTRAGNHIAISDEDGKESILIETPESKLSIELDQKGGKITVIADKEFNLTVDGGKVNVKCKEVSIKGDSKVEIASAEIKLKGDSKVEIKAPDVKISSPKVAIG